MDKLSKFFVPLMTIVFVFTAGGYFFYNNNDMEETIFNNVVVNEFLSYFPQSDTVGWSSEYKEADQKIDEMYTLTNNLFNSGEIYDEYSLPTNTASDLYIQSFLNRLLLLREDLRTMKDDSIDENTDYVYRIETIKNDTNALYEAFTQGDNFTPVHIDAEEGKNIVDMGINGNNRQYIDDETLRLERTISSTRIRGERSSDEAEKIAGILGVEIVYGLDNLPDSCVTSMSTQSQNIVALMCTADMTKMYVNVEHANGNPIDSPSFIDYVKHELAHKRIFEQCGTMMPEISKKNYESVTSSYAVKYLGANYGNLQESSKKFSEYAMNSQSDKIAEQIHDQGRCV